MNFFSIVHCRRRKIRCLLAPDDTQGRCENCIRLKKECHFYPVDQQPAVDKRGRPISKPETAGSDASLTTTPPLLGSGAVMEQKESYFPYPNMGISSGQDISAYNSGAYPGTPVATYTPDPLAAPELGAIPNAAQAVPTWNEPIYEPQVSGMVLRPSPGAVVPPGAMPHPSTGPMTVTPDATGIPPVNMSTAGFGASPHDSTAWGSQISRSMSLSARPGVPSPIPQAYPSQYHPSPPINPEFKRRMTTPAESYSSLGHVPSVPQLPSTPVPVSYDEAQIPFTTYNIPGSISGQVIVGSAADPMSLSEWYSPDSLQAHQQGFIPDQQNLMHRPPG
ncbi:hypothetical protein H103_08839 [Trichophyton rubrum CBS 288.86]|uniref:Zn(2)-C6 fungal-type domain-containing protein n=1 Tax=Trichophyton rubrum CBS 288.86 TaxID=1215330 RepID=A0A022VLS6_TRIRU|nr:hypothetical protein H103_08839 [Trichophyton rubrum CBS 288.86]